MIEELDENKMVSMTIGSRINVKYMAALTQYFYGQGIRSQGSIVRAALELFAQLLIDAGKVKEFELNAESIKYLNTVYPCKGVSYQKASTTVNAKGLKDQNRYDKELILGAIAGFIHDKGGENG